MGGAKKSTWIGATVFVALLFMAAAWLLVVGPTRSQGSDLRGQTDEVKASNQVLSAKITKLAAEFQKLPDYQKQLAQLRIQVPTTAQLSEYLRELDAIATADSRTTANRTLIRTPRSANQRVTTANLPEIAGADTAICGGVMVSVDIYGTFLDLRHVSYRREAPDE